MRDSRFLNEEQVEEMKLLIEMLFIKRLILLQVAKFMTRFFSQHFPVDVLHLYACKTFKNILRISADFMNRKFHLNAIHPSSSSFLIIHRFQ